ncbi:MAG: PASTA domain-containing protein, partial [Elusimicrobia bacterium]|nr:PASTA domain-containing protein [Elusimicrobiota bacterium]
MLKNFVIKTLLFFLQLGLVIGISYGAFEWLMQSIVHARKEVVVPDLRGKTIHQAVAVLSPAGLALAGEGEEYAPQMPVGAVIKQHPLAGATVREGKIVRVVVSMGSEKISVPELIGLPLRKAEIEIRSSQLALGETTEIFSLKQPKSYVVDQYPKPLSLTEKGEMINLVISLGEPPSDRLIVPDFTGKDSDNAAALAKDNSIEIRIHEDWNVPAGSLDRAVLKQSLAPDTILDRERDVSSKIILELTVARNLSPSAMIGAIEYSVPEKPARQREVVLKLLVRGGERQVYRGRAGPGEKVRLPLGQLPDKNQARLRIYLDGVFT